MERPDPAFRDHFARSLAGPHGEEIARSIPFMAEWAFVARTMVEVDLPDIIAYKEELLAGETPVCSLERVSLDLSDVSARRALFERLGRSASRVLVVSEGLLIYLAPEEVGALARDLVVPGTFHSWALDISSPGLLKMIQKDTGPQLSAAGAALKFAPVEGPDFFLPHGWKSVDVRSPLKTAARLKRLPFFLRLVAMLPASSGQQGSRPWSGVCLFERARTGPVSGSQSHTRGDAGILTPARGGTST